MLQMSDFIEKEDLIKFQINSYNYLLEKGLQDVINEKEDIIVDVEGYNLEFGKIRVANPVVKESGGSTEGEPRTPFECRLRNLTYSAPIMLGFVENDKRVEVEIGHLPVMLKSKICLLNGLDDMGLIKNGEDPEDPGGYFVINGTERTLIIVEDLAPNRIVTTLEEVGDKEIATAKVFSVRQGFRSRVTVEKRETMSGETLFVSFPGIPGRISLTIIMKALGLTSDDILNMFEDESRMEILLNLESNKYETPEEAFAYLGRQAGKGHAKIYQATRAEQVMNNYLLPHSGNSEKDRILKAKYLAVMAKKVVEMDNKKREADDKDHYSNKRLRTAGDLLQELFRVSFNTLCRDIKYQLEKQHARRRECNVKIAVRSNTLSERIDYALATGNWTGGKSGVSQVLDRTNYLSSIAHRRRVASLLSRSHPHFEARDLHATQWGRVCPNETPEGQNCGLVKNLAIGSRISTHHEDDKFEEYLKEFGVSHENKN